MSPDGDPPADGPSAPSIVLPRGGGAIRGIGEKFAANPVNGTGAMSVPLSLTPGRSGFGPGLTLSYNSGESNGVFGLGWSLSAPTITRRTDKGLPLYRDDEESDVFVLSGAEDLVPVLAAGRFADTTTAPGYTIARYRPRVEGLFARIERWTGADGEVHWRSITRDNILTVYGATPTSRIADPADTERVFSWLVCQTRDDKGNAIVYDYAADDGEGIEPAAPHQRNRGKRGDARRSVNRYLTRIRYGNRKPLLDSSGRRPLHLSSAWADAADWMFEAVFDYDQGRVTDETSDAQGRRFLTASTEPSKRWTSRVDAFSTYRSGFEVRTTRLCRRVLMFHHFPGDPDVGAGCLVRSTDFTYAHEPDPAGAPSPSYTYLTAVTHSGFKRAGDRYLQRSLPAVEFTYTLPRVSGTVEYVDADSVQNLPGGLGPGAPKSGGSWIDLHGEGTPGLLTEQGAGWFYKRNLSPLDSSTVQLAPLERVTTRPNVRLADAQLMDLAGDGSLDVVVLDGPAPGSYEHDDAEGWAPFRPFTSRLNRPLHGPGVRLVDLDGDGLADVLVTEDSALVWHPSLGEEGFGAGRRLAQALDEETGPRLAYADSGESIHLADLSGDGLSDVVRVRNGEVCYWPNLGYGSFGAKITMEDAPWLDNPGSFDPGRLRLADIDGSGTTDLIYLHRDGVRLYFNQSGNGWSAAHVLPAFPRVDDLATVTPADLLGNGTACLVWSSPLPAQSGQPLRYVRLMGADKPHLLVGSRNSLGARTRVTYAPSTRFYLQDKRDGRPWVTKLPFPVHVVERVETYDEVSGNRFVSRYAYHSGYFDGQEREFRGFGMVEQWDTEDAAGEEEPASGTNLDAASFVPPVLTKTWFHTGGYLVRDRVSTYFADAPGGISGSGYYREPGSTDAAARASLLPDTVLPAGLTLGEEREACRALKGATLRQEVYGLDGTPAQDHPYVVVERNYAVARLQQRRSNRHAVFLPSPRETLHCDYDRDPHDPRVTSSMTLETDDLGNVRKALAVAYGRRPGRSPLLGTDRDTQERLLVTYTESDYTQPEDGTGAEWVGAYRTPGLSETRTYDVTGLALPAGGRFLFEDLAKDGSARLTALPLVRYEDAVDPSTPGRRLIECTRTLHRRDDLTALLPRGRHGVLGLPGQTYRLAFTPGLLQQVYRRADSPLLPTPADVLSGAGEDRGGYVDLDGDGSWWNPSGRTFYSSGPGDDAAAELAYARRHFFVPHRHQDAFGQAVSLFYDIDDARPEHNHTLLPVRISDALGNVIAAGNDYRVLQPRQVTDPNGNRSEVAFDALGMVVATAVSGKAAPAPVEGDSLSGVPVDLSPAEIAAYFESEDPRPLAVAHLGAATTRILYDVGSVPVCAAAILRETHQSDLGADEQTAVQLGFSYSDGFGREIQQKVQAELGPVPRRDTSGQIMVGAGGSPELVPGDGRARWIGSGWTVYNNKGKPVRRFEPFFSDTHHLDADARIGRSARLCYDPAQRVVATLHPNATYEKVAFGPWQQATYDTNDTVLQPDGSPDPLEDADIKGFLGRLPAAEYSPTWYEQRISRAADDPERTAAQQAAVHRQTPTVAHLDALGRPFLTQAHNRFLREGAPVEEVYATRIELDIEGNRRALRDAVAAGDEAGRRVTRHDFDLLGTPIRESSMEAGERWFLRDVSGNLLRRWDSRGFTRRMTYDALRRPTGMHVTEVGAERLAERTLYGERQGSAGNHRTRAYQTFDGAGRLTHVGYDFKGDAVATRRDLLASYRTAADWATDPAVDDGSFVTTTRYDALGRLRALTTPDGSVYRPRYNAAKLLEAVDLQMAAGQPAGTPAWTPLVTNIDYDAQGQRTGIAYANGTVTTMSYDPQTSRLSRLRTTRADLPDTTASSLFLDGTVVQDLRYTYDPAGNLTRIVDAALRTVFTGNAKVDPACSYTYDAVYRLTEATGREHVGQTAHVPAPPGNARRDHDIAGLAALTAHPQDLQALRTYVERFAYDPAGNISTVRHRAKDGNWTRSYTYAAPSLLEVSRRSNRLTRTDVGNGGAYSETYGYADPAGADMHGCMTSINSLTMGWDFEDQLQRADLGGGGTAYYVYDTDGERVRKVLEDAGGNRRSERIYVGVYELFRSFGTGAVTRSSLHVMDDKQRIAIVDTQAAPQSAAPVVRYQLGNHLGSASLELDVGGAVITYEEYHPYGTSSFQAGRSAAEVSLKRYRYTGRERDEETGLGYHSHRLTAPWLGRWVSPDPAGDAAGPNRYAFAACNPVRYRDLNGRDPEPSTWDRIKASGPVQFLGGAAAGATSSYIPGGFLLAPVGAGTGVLSTPSRAFQAGYGVAEMIAGLQQIVVGGGGEVVGGVADATVVGAIVGVPINIASAAVIVQGSGNMVAGGANLLSAVLRPEPAKPSAPQTKPDVAAPAATAKPPSEAAPPAKPPPPKPPAPKGGGGTTAAPPRSLKGLAEKAGVRAEIEGEIEVFAHGTTGTVAKEMVETQGGNLGAAGGAHGGKVFAVPDVAVAEVFAARTAGRVAGAEPAVVGIALPRSVVTQLKQQKLLVSRPVPNPPQGVSSGAQEWVFQPGALETLKAHGFFFAVH